MVRKKFIFEFLARKQFVTLMRFLFCLGLKKLTEFLKEPDNAHVHEIEVPERTEDKAVMDEFKAALTSNKNAGKKKGKKKGGKKKKKG